MYPVPLEIVNVSILAFTEIKFISLTKTRTVRGSDYRPAVELSEQKDKLVTKNWRD